MIFRLSKEEEEEFDTKFTEIQTHIHLLIASFVTKQLKTRSINLRGPGSTAEDSTAEFLFSKCRL